MSRNAVIIIFVAVSAAGWTLYHYYLGQFRPKYSWYESYYHDGDQPYDLSVLYRLMEERDTGFRLIARSAASELDTTATGANYIYIGQTQHLGQAGTTRLLDYVRRGNRAFIATSEMPYILLYRLAENHIEEGDADEYFLESNYDYDSDSLAEVGFFSDDSTYTFHYRFGKVTTGYSWSCLRKDYFHDTLVTMGMTALGHVADGHVNFYRLRHGDGAFYFHTNPILFTNYNIIREEGYAYARRVLGHLGPGEVHWDIASRYAPVLPGANDGEIKSPLKFLFSHRTLQWGWYLVLALLLLYLLFRSKREQRIIPVPEKNENSAVAYTRAVGALYFGKGRMEDIAEEMTAVFLARIRSRYRLDTGMKHEMLSERLAERSGVSPEKVQQIFRGMVRLRYNKQRDHTDLMNYHRSLEHFYKNCK